MFLRPIDLVAQPQPHIQRDLFIAASPGVDFIRQAVHTLLQLTDHERVNVFIVGAFVKRRGLRVGLNRCERIHQLFALLRGENARSFQGPRKSLRPLNIGVDQPPVEMERAGESFKDLRGPLLEPASPQLHAHFLTAFFLGLPMTEART